MRGREGKDTLRSRSRALLPHPLRRRFQSLPEIIAELQNGLGDERIHRKLVLRNRSPRPGSLVQLAEGLESRSDALRELAAHLREAASRWVREFARAVARPRIIRGEPARSAGRTVVRGGNIAGGGEGEGMMDSALE